MPANFIRPDLHNMEPLAPLEETGQKTFLYRSTGAGIYAAEKFTGNPG